MAGRADQVKVTRMAIRRLEARAPLAEVNLPGDAGVDHPLQRAVDGRPSDARGLAVDALEQIVGADVPLLAEEHLHDPITLGRAFATRGSETGKVGEGTIHVVNWRVGELANAITNSPIHQFADRYSTLNDCPQPQVDVACGFLIVNPPPVIVSTKSTSAPVR